MSKQRVSMSQQPGGEETPVGIWIRVSTEDQARGESPEHHEHRARMYAESRGWTVTETYDLSGVSGKSVMHHPETQRMLRDIRAKRISALIFSKLARLARNTRELLDFADIFRECDADLVSLQEAIDTSTPAGRLFYTMIAAMATWEREEIAERVAVSVGVRAKLGKPLGGAAPFGYRWVDRKLVPDPKEAPVLRLLFDLFAEHGRKKTVARLLNEAGHRTRGGAKFGDTTVHRLLTDPTSKGQHRLNHTQSLGDGRRWVRKPETEWSFLTVEPVVPPELWERCNAMIEERKRRPPTKRTTTLFAGVVFCGCGYKMYVPSNSPKYICYRCRNKIPVTDLENVFHAQLKDFFFSPADIARHLETADITIKEKTQLLAAIESEEKRLTAESEKLYRLYLDGNLSSAGFGEKNRPIEERLTQLREELPRLQGEIDFLKIRYLSASDIVSEAQTLWNRWPNLEFEEKRRIVETITEKITIGKGDDISLDLCYLPPPSEIMAEGHRNLRGSGRRRG
jgi:site-specific DNA recombinase